MRVTAFEVGSVARAALRPGVRGRTLLRFSRGACLETGDGTIVWLDDDPDAFSPRGITVNAFDASGPFTVVGVVVRFSSATLALDGVPSPSHRIPYRPTTTQPSLLQPALDDAIARFLSTADPLPLLGLGAGLTPAGDDFLGGYYLARHLDGRPLDATVLLAAARTRTHPISLARLHDHAHGSGTRAELAFARTGDPAAREALARHGASSGSDFARGVRAARESSA